MADCCVVGVQDDYQGEVPIAYIVLSPSAITCAGEAGEAEGEIIKDIMDVCSFFSWAVIVMLIGPGMMQHVARLKAKYKHLRGVQLVDSIPVSLLRSSRFSFPSFTPGPLGILPNV